MAKNSPTILANLDDGLVLRRSTRADAGQLADFNGMIHRGSPDAEPQHGVAAWTRDLLERDHPTFGESDFTVIEDTHTGAIVSSLNLISQRWSYGGVAFGVGRPEIVGTHPDYRGRGLVRAQFDVIHRWSAERGEMVQGITGIPYFYRQFGYEMALAFGGARSGFKPHLPELAAAQEEPYTLRPALAADLPFIASTYAHGAARWAVSCMHDDVSWRYILSGRRPESIVHEELRIIAARDGRPVGFLAHPRRLWSWALGSTLFELAPGESYAAVAPAVLRYLWNTGQQYAAAEGKSCEGYQLALGAEHPAYAACAARLPQSQPPYAWYIRVADLPGFLRHIAPALERRLDVSPCAGHTGDLRIGFFRDGLRLTFDGGRLTAVESWRPTPHIWGDAFFPDLTFLHLVFGHRSFEEIRYAYPDCGGDGNDAPALLSALFPKRPSCVWAVS